MAQSDGLLRLIFGWWNDKSITQPMNSWLSEAQQEMNSTSGYDKLYLYMNYAKVEPVQSYYGYEPWRLQRLQQLKKKYDPLNRFFGYHPIPV